MKRVLFVCLGNICRSPLAEGILRNMAQERKLDLVVDSCGTDDFHAGDAPDPRSIAIAKKHGFDISDIRSRQFVESDFESFDYIYVMDKTNYADLLQIASNSSQQRKIEMVLNLMESTRYQNVPDPYYGNKDGFEEVYQLLNTACEQILINLKNAI